MPSLRVLAYGNEPLADFVARLARRHGAISAREFLKHHRMPAAGVLQGHAVEQIARFADVNPAILGKGVAVAILPTGVEIAGQDLGRQFRRPRTAPVCPACLREDEERLRGPATFRAHRRSIWLLDAVVACPEHGCRLIVPEPAELHPVDPRRIDPRFGGGTVDLSCVAVEAATRSEVALARFVAGRLGCGVDQTPELIRDMSLKDALALFVRLGALRDAGAGPSSLGLKKLGRIETDAAMLAGYDVVADGPTGIVGFARELTARAARGARSAPTPRKVYGRFLAWLLENRARPGFQPLIDVVVEHGLAELSVDAKSRFFQGRTEHRAIYPLSAAAKELGVRKWRAYEALIALGHLEPRPLCENGRRVGIADLPVARSSLSEVRDFLDDLVVTRSANAILGFKASVLVKAGLISRHLSDGKIAKGERKLNLVFYSRRELDEFLGRVCADAPLVLTRPTGQISVTECLRTFRVPVLEMLQAILAGKITPTAVMRTSAPGLAGVLVRTDDVRQLVSVRSQAPSGTIVGMAQLAAALGVSGPVAKDMVDLGLVQSSGWRCVPFSSKMRAFQGAEIERVRRELITARQLATLYRLSALELNKILHRAGIQALVPVGNTLVYRKSEVEEALGAPGPASTPPSAPSASQAIARSNAISAYRLTDDQWEWIESLMPRRLGPHRLDDRLFVDAVLIRHRAGIPWHDLPAESGRWGTVYARFVRSVKQRLITSILERLASDPANPHRLLDARLAAAIGARNVKRSGARGGAPAGQQPR